MILFHPISGWGQDTFAHCTQGCRLFHSFLPAALGFTTLLRTAGVLSFPRQCEASPWGEMDFRGPSGLSHSLFVRPLENEPVPLVQQAPECVLCRSWESTFLFSQALWEEPDLGGLFFPPVTCIQYFYEYQRSYTRFWALRGCV